jgi:tripartite-type tricarboxylate transporter receptor subunit TctC
LQKEKSPAEDPLEVIALLQKQIAEIVHLPDFKATLDKLSYQPVGSTSAQFADQIKNGIVVWSKVMKDANIPVN